MPVIKAAIVQHPPVFLNLAASVAKATRLIEEAAAHGANVIAFPETWLPGYPVWLDLAPEAAVWDHPPAQALYQVLVENSLVIPSPHFDGLLAAAGRAEAHVIMSAHERVDGTLYNTMIFIDRNGKDFRLHRKLVPTYTERLVWGRGDGSTLAVVDTEFGKLGGLICWEHWMPLARAALHAKSEVVHVAQWPTVNDLHQLASRHYAFEGQCFVLAAGTVLSRGDVLAGFDSLQSPPRTARELLAAIPGDDSTLLQRGGSCLIAPDTSFMAGPLFNQAGIVYADLDPALIARGHLVMDTNGHYSRPDVFQLEVNEAVRSNVRFKT